MVAQQEMENQRLQAELERMATSQDRARMDAQRREFTKALDRVSQRLVSGGGPGGAGGAAGGADGGADGGPSDQASAMAAYAEHQATALRAIESLPRDSELYQLQRVCVCVCVCVCADDVCVSLFSSKSTSQYTSHDS